MHDPARTGSLSTFISNLPVGFAIGEEPVEQRLLAEYGAVFVARGVQSPKKVVFRDQREVLDFQESLEIGRAELGGFAVELQAQALEALLRAIHTAESQGLSITPRGPDSARRDYDETVGLWLSRVEPGLKHWTEMGRLTASDAEKIAGLSTFEQVVEILSLEEKGLFFAKDLSKSIIYSVAPPGTSQHLSLLALDVAEFDDASVRQVMAEHKWYQTVVSDLPHFTYLGISESGLPHAGLRRVESSSRTFWVPDI